MQLASIKQTMLRKPAKEIMVIAAGGLGDCLLLTPFIRHFKLKDGYSKVVVVVNRQAQGVFYSNPYVDQVIPCNGDDIFIWGLPEEGRDIFSPYYTIDSVATEFSAKVDRKLNLNTQDEQVLSQLAANENILLEDYALDVFYSAADLSWAESVLTSLPRRPAIVLSVQSPLREKQYPTELWRLVIEKLTQEFNVLELRDTESEFSSTTVCSPMPSVVQSAALFSLVSCVLSIDSFPIHLAHAVNTPTVVLWGPTNPKAFGYSDQFNLRDEECPPCANTPRLYACRDRICLNRVKPDSVVDAVRRAMRVTPLNKLVVQ